MIATPHVDVDDRDGVGGVEGYTMPVADALVQLAVLAAVAPQSVVFT